MIHPCNLKAFITRDVPVHSSKLIFQSSRTNIQQRSTSSIAFSYHDQQCSRHSLHWRWIGSTMNFRRITIPKYHRTSKLDLVKNSNTFFNWYAIDKIRQHQFDIHRSLSILSYYSLRPTIITTQFRLYSSGVPLLVQDENSRTDISSLSLSHMSATTTLVDKGYERFFDLELPEGRCIGLKLLDLPSGHPDELSKETILRYSNHRQHQYMLMNDNDSSIISNSTTTSNYQSLSNMGNTGNNNNNNNNFINKQYHWIYDKLHTDEINYGLSNVRDGVKNQKCFWLGRLAIREGLRLLLLLHNNNSSTKYDNLLHNVSILKDEYGRPRVPNGYIGSISHKETIGVALICPQQQNDDDNNDDDANNNRSSSNENNNTLQQKIIQRSIGVDIEKRLATRKSIARKVLTPFEINDLGQIPGISIEEEVLLRFSLKECVYKAIHPLLCQYITFQEAEIKPLPDGTAITKLMLKSGAHVKLGPITAHWQCYGTEYFISSSSAVLLQ